MRKAFVLINLLIIGVFVCGFLILKSTVLDHSVIASNARTENTIEAPYDKSDPHSGKNYDDLSPDELQTQAATAEENIKMSLTQFLMLEVKAGRMTMSSANELQERIYEALESRSSLPTNTQPANPQSEL